MTVIYEPVETIGGADNDTMFTFASQLRDSSDGTTLITTPGVRVTPQGGVLTTPDLDPGPATVQVGLKEYAIEIPDSASPVRLWPLIQEGLPVPPEQMATAVVDGGGVSVMRSMSADDYAALVSSTTPIPGSVFLVY